jgi:hypothetical protein
MRHPPGDEIYRDGKISVFEVDGRKNKVLVCFDDVIHIKRSLLDILSEPLSASENVP